MQAVISQPTYLPWLGYFYLMSQADAFVFLDDVQFVKRSWQCRNRIKGSNGEVMLTVPVKRDDKLPINEVMINNNDDWAKRHMRAIETSYGSCKFYENYRDYFKELYNKEWNKLAELNMEIIRFIAKISLKTLNIRSNPYFDFPYLRGLCATGTSIIFAPVMLVNAGKNRCISP